MAIEILRAPYSTNCERVALAMAAKRIAPDSETVISYEDRSAVIAASGQPLVPVLIDGGEAIADSQAILRHLERRFPDPPLYPEGGVPQARVRVFSEWFDAAWKLEPNLIEAELVAAEAEGREPDAELVGRCAAVIGERTSVFESLLDGVPFLIGERASAADFVAFPFLKYARGREAADPDLFHRILDEHLTLDGFPRLAEWIERVDEMPRAFGP